MSSPFDEAKYNALLKGLEVSEVRFSDLKAENRTFRIDSNFFSREILELDENIKSRKHFYIPKNRIVSGPFGSSLTSEAYLSQGGVPFIRIENIKQGFSISRENMIYISESDNARLKSSQLKLDDLILSKVGNTIGFYARVDEEIKNCNISENNIGIKLDDFSIEQKHYILTYMNSKIGYALTYRRISGNAQPKLNVFDISEIPIPEMSEKFMKNISSMICKSKAKLTESKALYKQAEDTLLSELDLKNWQPKNETVSIKKFSNFDETGRLDAEYYQLKYDEIQQKLSTYNTTTIPSQYDIFKNSGTNYSDGISDVGVVKTKQLTNAGIDLDGVESYFDESTCFYNNSTFIQNSDVIFASMGVGSLGKASVFTSDTETRYVTDSTLRIFRAKDNAKVLPEVLCIFLQSAIGQEIIYRYVVGSTGIINIYDTDIAKIPIPILDNDTQKEIALKVQKAFAYRHKSKELLEHAKQAVERAIEQGEDVALEWLETRYKDGY